MTAVFAGRAGFRAGLDASTQYHEAVIENEPLPEHLLEAKHIVQTYWREYVPAAIALSATVASIITANSIGSRRAAAIAAAFKLSEKMTEEYRQKVVATLGGKNEEKMRGELAKEKMERTPGRDMIVVSGTETLFFDEYSGRYFKNDIESVRKAVNEINHKVNNYFCASLSEFYEKIGLENTAISDEIGWNSDGLLDVIFSATLVGDSQAAISIAYNKTPIAGYDRCQ
jgi:hypothetical protein